MTRDYGSQVSRTISDCREQVSPCGEKPEDGDRDVHCPLVLGPPLAPPGSLSPKISSLHRRPCGSSVLPATADFSATAHNGRVMRCVVKKGLVEKRNPFLPLPRKHSGMALRRRYILSTITDHADRSSEGDLKFRTRWRINYRSNLFSTR